MKALATDTKKAAGMHRLLGRGYGAPLDAEHIEKIVAERLALGFFGGGVAPLTGKADGTVADFVPGKHQEVSKI